MSCQTLGKTCDTLNDCIGSTNTPCDSAVCLSNKCTSTNCSSDGDCPDDMKCQNGSCTQYSCAKDSDCTSPYMKCQNGLCSSINCPCPKGSSCVELSGGEQVCVANTGINDWWFILAIILCIIAGVVVVVAFVFAKKMKDKRSFTSL